MKPALRTAVLPCVSLTLFGSVLLQAEEVPPALEEVIVTALPIRSTVLDSTQPVAVLSGERLLRQREVSLGETLARMPGVTASAFGPIASRPVLRGQGGLRVQTYQDSADTLDVAALSDDHAVTVDPLVARSIEVLRGPAALMFGNSAAAGAVNIVTARIPIEPQTERTSGALEIQANTLRDDVRGGAALTWRINDALQLSADGHRARSADLHIPGYAWSAALREAQGLQNEPVDESRDRLPNSDGSSEGANLGIGWLGARSAFGVAVSRSDMNYGLPGPGEEEGEPSDIRLDLQQTRVDFAGEWRPAAGPFQSVRLRGSSNDYAHLELEDDDVGTRYAQRGEEWRLTAEHGVDRSKKWRGALGLQWRNLDFDAEGDEAFLPASLTRNLGIFAFQELNLDRWTLDGGVRLEQQRIDSSAVNETAYDELARSGSFGLRWRWHPAVTGTLQLNFFERHPTTTELLADGPHLAVRRYEIGDLDLGKERGRNIDLGLKLSGGLWRAEISAFAADYDDYIVAAPTDEEEDELPVVRFTAQQATFRGGEFSVNGSSIARLGRGSLGIEFFGDYVRARDVDGDPLPQIPPLRLGSGLSWDDSQWRIGVEAVWHDRQSRVAENERSTAGYTLIGFDIGYRHPFGSGARSLWFLRGSNLLDAEARRHVSPLKDFAPLRGRSVSAGFRLDFR